MLELEKERKARQSSVCVLESKILFSSYRLWKSVRRINIRWPSARPLTTNTIATPSVLMVVPTHTSFSSALSP